MYLSGPVSHGDGILDYNGQASITGGTVFAAGSSGMMQTFGENSTQNYLVVYCEEAQQEGTVIRLTDGENQLLGEYASPKAFDTIIISAPELKKGAVYHLALGEKADTGMEIEVTNVETVWGKQSANTGIHGAHGDFRKHRGEPPEGKEPPEGVEFPKGREPPDRKELPEEMSLPE